MRHAVFALTLLACTENQPSTPIEGGGVVINEAPIGQNRAIDILFVIDDSASMADKQDNLWRNFGNFIHVLDTVEGGRPDLHLGVVSTDLGARGVLDAEGGAGISGCTANGRDGVMQTGTAQIDGRFLSDVRVRGGRNRNYVGELSAAFSQMAVLGSDGCEVEQPLEAMQRALEHPTNAGFLRDDATLMVVFITDEDDCSFLRGVDMLAANDAYGPVEFRCTRYGVTCEEGGTTPAAMASPGAKSQCHPTASSPLIADVDRYVEFLQGLKPDSTDRVFVATITGMAEPVFVNAGPSLAPSCSYTTTSVQSATPAVRLQALAQAFPNRSQVETVCQQNLSGALQQVAQMFKVTLGVACLEGDLLDANPELDGLQPDCSMTWTTAGTSDQVPACADAPLARPCYYLDGQSDYCPGFTYIGTERSDAPLPETLQRLECVTDR